jgi:hypothetical protein
MNVPQDKKAKRKSTHCVQSPLRGGKRGENKLAIIKNKNTKRAQLCFEKRQKKEEKENKNKRD